jgi:hypothetical protein
MKLIDIIFHISSLYIETCVNDEIIPITIIEDIKLYSTDVVPWSHFFMQRINSNMTGITSFPCCELG